MIPNDPAQSLEIGADDGGSVGEYANPGAIQGAIDEVRVFHGQLTEADVASRFDLPKSKPAKAKLVLSHSYDGGNTKDASGNGNDGKADGTQKVDGIVGGAFRFRGSRGRAKGSFVQHAWRQNVPLLVRSMLKINDNLVVAGPPDIIDEESTFQRLVDGDSSVNDLLAKQDDMLNGEQGAILRLVSAVDGSDKGELKLDSLPVWDGVATAYGNVYVATEDGHIVTLGGE